MRKALVWLMLWCAGALVAILVVGVTLGILGAEGLIQEDDAWWNCHVMGNMTCGPDNPWHGFVNNFRHADYR